MNQVPDVNRHLLFRSLFIGRSVPNVWHRNNSTWHSFFFFLLGLSCLFFVCSSESLVGPTLRSPDLHSATGRDGSGGWGHGWGHRLKKSRVSEPGCLVKTGVVTQYLGASLSIDWTTVRWLWPYTTGPVRSRPVLGNNKTRWGDQWLWNKGSDPRLQLTRTIDREQKGVRGRSIGSETDVPYRLCNDETSSDRTGEDYSN